MQEIKGPGSRELIREERSKVSDLILSTQGKTDQDPGYYVSRAQIARELGIDDSITAQTRRLDARITVARQTLSKIGYIVFNEPDKGYRIAEDIKQREIEMTKALLRAVALMRNVRNINIRYQAGMRNEGLEVPEAFQNIRDIELLIPRIQDIANEAKMVVNARKQDDGPQMKPSQVIYEENRAERIENASYSD